MGCSAYKLVSLSLSLSGSLPPIHCSTCPQLSFPGCILGLLLWPVKAAPACFIQFLPQPYTKHWGEGAQWALCLGGPLFQLNSYSVFWTGKLRCKVIKNGRLCLTSDRAEWAPFSNALPGTLHLNFQVYSAGWGVGISVPGSSTGVGSASETEGVWATPEGTVGTSRIMTWNPSKLLFFKY